MPQTDAKVGNLADAILAQAAAEAKQIIAAAQAEAERTIAEAREQASRQSETALLDAEAKAKREGVVEIAAASLDCRRKLLQAREELIDRVFDKVKERLAAIRNSDEYWKILLDLIREGCRAIGKSNLIVETAAADREAANRAVAATAIENISIKVQANDEINDGGCIVSDSDRRVIFDNTFEAILARHRARLRKQVAETLWGREVRWNDL
jgi:V/A-type H+-transporting ATPase subunit E